MRRECSSSVPLPPSSTPTAASARPLRWRRSRSRHELDRVEVVREPLEDAQARLGNGEEPVERTIAEPRQLRLSGEHRIDRRAVAAERDELDAVAPRLEHCARGLAGRVDEDARLLLAAAAEPVRR